MTVRAPHARRSSAAAVLTSLAVFGGVLSGCALAPEQLEMSERERVAAESIEKLFSGGEPPSASVSLAEATARAIKYHADNRVRLLEETLASAQLDVAKFDLLPRLTTNAGYSTRNNDSFGFGFSPNGTIATNPSASSERSHDTFSIGLSWNILDLGVSYFRAKQMADQRLIAEERSRKAMQTLVHDVRQAWWRAEAAQRLLPEVDALFDEMEQALEKTRLIEARKLLPPVQVISLRRALMDLQQQISFRRQDLAQARVELAALLNVRPGTEVKLPVVDPAARKLLDLAAAAEKLDALALRNRPEMAEESYKARVNDSEIKRALVAILPGLSFDLTNNFDSNRFLVNSSWTSMGVNVAFNLVKAFSIPAMNRSADAQRRVDEARQLAMAMAILTQTRIATTRYALIAHEYGVWRGAATDDDQIVKMLESSNQVGIDSELELIRAKARSTISRINRDLTYANLEAAMARIYNSVGFDAVSDRNEQLGMAELTRAVEERLGRWQQDVFVPVSEPALPSVALGDIAGMDAKSTGLIREGMMRVLETARVRVAAPEVASLRIAVRGNIEAAKSGGRPSKLDVQVLSGSSGAQQFAADFKTTLTDPLEDEQLRILGEGAAYRVVTWISASRFARNPVPLRQGQGAADAVLAESKPGAAPVAVAQPVVPNEPVVLVSPSVAQVNVVKAAVEVPAVLVPPRLTTKTLTMPAAAIVREAATADGLILKLASQIVPKSHVQSPAESALLKLPGAALQPSAFLQTRVAQ